MTHTAEALADLVDATRTIGSDPSLVLAGGGNSSLKTTTYDLAGRTVPTLWIKGSGQDMATITADGFAPLRLELVRGLLPPVVVPDADLENQLRCALLDARAPDPSVETLLHVMLPDAAVLHSHADAVLALSDSVQGPRLVREVLGDSCVIVDYAMPGPDLLAACDAAWSGRRGDEVGIVVIGHGLFTVGDTPAEALRRHLDVVTTAAAALPTAESVAAAALPEPVAADLATLRCEVCAIAGQQLVMTRIDDPVVAEFLADPELTEAVRRGPLTPDHASWTRPFWQVGRDVAGHAEAYRAYFEQHRSRRGAGLAMLDPAPRIILDADLGLLALGRTAKEAAAAAEIARHTMAAVRQATVLGGYRPASPGHVFDLEYWAYQQEKLRRSKPSGDLAGQVALVTGAASGIGRGCAAALLEAGACVVGWDLAENVVTTFDSPNYLGLRVDVTDPERIATALQQQVEAFGGLDILVPAAGIFPASTNLGELDPAQWRRTMNVNVDSVVELYNQTRTLLEAAVPYGRVVLIASKNVAAPGPGAAAYSSSKAAVTQLTRVAALEWAPAGIRVNIVHPDAVFDTALWTPELLAARAEHYGMAIDEYKRRNLLRAEVTSAGVGRMVRALCSQDFACTTGAQVPIDGGNERVI